MGILEKSLIVDGITIPNRVVFQPMEGCDCNEDGSPGELTVKKYLAEARSGAGLIWLEATAVCPEGRTNKRQMRITDENLAVYKDFVRNLKAAGLEENGFEPVIIIQLTHSGRQSIVPMIAYRHPFYDKRKPVTDENIVTDEYLDSVPAMYADAAMLAYEAGFDGVDVKSCHGYLFQEFLSAFGRPGRYGGSFENRTRLYVDCIRAVKKALTTIENARPFIVSSRLGISDMVAKPYGFGTDENNNIDLTESKKLIEIIHAEGVNLLNITIGNPYFNPHINRPFRKGGYVPPEAPEAGLERFYKAQKEIKDVFPTITLVGSAFSYYRGEMMNEAEKQIGEGVCDMAGFGRVSLAYPDFYKDYLNGTFLHKKTCVTCSKCTELMRAGLVSGCAVFNEYYRELYKEKILCQKK